MLIGLALPCGIIKGFSIHFLTALHILLLFLQQIHLIELGAITMHLIDSIKLEDYVLNYKTFSDHQWSENQ